MSDLTRRDAVRVLAATSLAAAFDWTPGETQRALGLAAAARSRAGRAYQPAFFSPHEWDTVRLLVDCIIPRDERSGSASDAGVPEFMDFLLADGDDAPRTAMRGGLAWLDTESVERFGHTFESSDPERATLLDLIAWPAKAPPELSHGVAFFNRFRDLTASGFWSSKMGVADLQYLGNTAVAEWTGCPPEALAKLGVRYE
jgi:hypothetical protein